MMNFIKMELPQEIGEALNEANAYVMKSHKNGESPDAASKEFFRTYEHLNLSLDEEIAFIKISQMIVEQQLGIKSEIDPKDIIKSCEILSAYGQNRKVDSIDDRPIEEIAIEKIKEQMLSDKIKRELVVHLSSISGFLWASDQLGRFYVDSFKAAREMFLDENLPDQIWNDLCLISVSFFENLRKWEPTYNKDLVTEAGKRIADYYVEKYTN
jgi:hypothetical protein